MVGDPPRPNPRSFHMRTMLWLLSLTTPPLLSIAAPEAGVETVTEFDRESVKSMPWRITDDGVMGGLSKGRVDFTDAGTMVFKGTLSLENSGGFSTARTGKVDLDLAGAEGFVVRVKGCLLYTSPSPRD